MQQLKQKNDDTWRAGRAVPHNSLAATSFSTHSAVALPIKHSTNVQVWICTAGSYIVQRACWHNHSMYALHDMAWPGMILLSVRGTYRIWDCDSSRTTAQAANSRSH